MLDPLSRVWEPLGWQPDATQVARFEQLRQELCRWNSRLNLTRLVEGDDYWIAQVFDSLWPWLPLLRAADAPLSDAPRLIDVGTGGGFPGLALAIALPKAHLTLVDSVARKLEAVEAMAREVGLAERVSLRRERVERTGHAPECRGHFDGAMARAVASAPVVAEYLVPLLRPGGRALLYRGQWSREDAMALTQAARKLRARVTRQERRDLPAGRGVRHALELESTGPCPEAYPRPVGVPLKQPLA